MSEFFKIFVCLFCFVLFLSIFWFLSFVVVVVVVVVFSKKFSVNHKSR